MKLAELQMMVSQNHFESIRILLKLTGQTENKNVEINKISTKNAFSLKFWVFLKYIHQPPLIRRM